MHTVYVSTQHIPSKYLPEYGVPRTLIDAAVVEEDKIDAEVDIVRDRSGVKHLPCLPVPWKPVLDTLGTH